MVLTGNRDVDMEIILQLEDRELPAVCAVNKYVNQICESDAFWYRRLLNRITKARDDNLSKYKDLLITDINGEKIREMQRFLGLKTLKELNAFLNELQPSAIYLAYYSSTIDSFGFDEYINKAYNINIREREFPKYINREELQYTLRKEALKARYERRHDRKIRYPAIQFNLRPTENKFSWRENQYNILKLVGIRL